MSIEQFVVADRAAKKGVNPSKGKGYQVAAISPGLDLATCEHMENTLANVANAISGSVPQARKKYEDWRRTRTQGEDAPETLLREFPLVWRYVQIEDGRFALSRIRYPVMTQDGRHGCFLAHTLVFPPEALAQVDYNPMALSGSDVFWSVDDGQRTELPSLDRLKAETPSERNYSLLSGPPYHDKLLQMISVLSQSGTGGRPLHICLSDFDPSERLLQLLLSLLPPAVRCRTTFLTLSDRRIPGADETTSRDDSIYHVHITCGENIRTLDLAASSYAADAARAVFNFAETQFAEIGPVPGYAEFAAEAVRRGNMRNLMHHHRLTGQLGLGENRDAWNALVPLARCDGSISDAEHLSEGLGRVGRFLTESGQAACLLREILPSVQSLARSDKKQELSMIAEDVSSLVEKAADPQQKEDVSSFLREIGKLCVTALQQGHASTTAALFKACGSRRTAVMRAVLEQLFRGPRTVFDEPQALRLPSAEEGQLSVKLLAEGLDVMSTGQEPPPWYGTLLTAVFGLAARVGVSQEIWSEYGPRRVMPFFEKRLDKERQEILKKLLEHIQEDLPKVYIKLNLKLLQSEKLTDQQLFSRLQTMVQVMHQCGEVELKEVLSALDTMVVEPEKLTLALACMFEKSSGHIRDAIFSKYWDDLEAMLTDQMPIRRTLAKAGYHRILAYEFLKRVRPWNEEKEKTFKRWELGLLSKYPQLREAVCNLIAGQMKKADGLQSLFPLVRSLLADTGPTAPARASQRPLWIALLTTLPLSALSSTKKVDFLAAAPSDLDGEARDNLRAAQTMVRVREIAQKKGLSLAELKAEKIDFACMRSLPPEKKKEVRKIVLEALKSTGLPSPDHAEGFWMMFDEMDERYPRRIVDDLQHLLGDRDRVTKIQVAMSFIQPALEGKGVGQHRDWLEVIHLLVQGFDRDTLKLLGNHIEHRFCRAEEVSESAKSRLYKLIGLRVRVAHAPKPKPPSPEPGRPETKRSVFGRLFRGRD